MRVPVSPNTGELAIHFATARYIPGKWDPPSVPPPYSSILDDVRQQMELFLRINEVRQNALHPVRLQAGQHSPVNGSE